MANLAFVLNDRGDIPGPSWGALDCLFGFAVLGDEATCRYGPRVHDLLPLDDRAEGINKLVGGGGLAHDPGRKLVVDASTIADFATGVGHDNTGDPVHAQFVGQGQIFVLKQGQPEVSGVGSDFFRGDAIGSVDGGPGNPIFLKADAQALNTSDIVLANGTLGFHEKEDQCLFPMEGLSYGKNRFGGGLGKLCI